MVIDGLLRRCAFHATVPQLNASDGGAECGACVAVICRTLTYLAVPYSHPDQAVRESRFRAANKAAAILMRRGDIVFSPISHTVPIAESGDLPLGWDYWQAFDKAYLMHTDRLVVLCIDGWRASVGVIAEIELACGVDAAIQFVRFDGGDLETLAEITTRYMAEMRAFIAEVPA